MFFRSPSPETSWGGPGEADIYVLPLITLADVFQTRSAHDFLTRARLSLPRKPVPMGKAAQRGVNSGTRACSPPHGAAFLLQQALALTCEAGDPPRPCSMARVLLKSR